MTSKANSKQKRFAELKALRKAGKKTFDSYEVHQEDSLYEEVDEERYKKIVRDRLNQDDFVVDDNGEGYADDGREEWDRPQYYSESEEEIVAAPRKGRQGTFSPHMSPRRSHLTDLEGFDMYMMTDIFAL